MSSQQTIKAIVCTQRRILLTLQSYVGFISLYQIFTGFSIRKFGFRFSVLFSLIHLSLHLSIYSLAVLWFLILQGSNPFSSQQTLYLPISQCVPTALFFVFYIFNNAFYFINFCGSLLFLILHPSLDLIGSNIFLNICLPKASKLFVPQRQCPVSTCVGLYRLISVI